DVGHADDRAWFWIELAKAMEVGRLLLRQDREVALDVAVGDARRRHRHAGPAVEPRPVAGKHGLGILGLLLCRKNSHWDDLLIISTNELNPKYCIMSNRVF